MSNDIVTVQKGRRRFDDIRDETNGDDDDDVR